MVVFDASIVLLENSQDTVGSGSPPNAIEYSRVLPALSMKSSRILASRYGGPEKIWLDNHRPESYLAGCIYDDK